MLIWLGWEDVQTDPLPGRLFYPRGEGLAIPKEKLKIRAEFRVDFLK